MISVDHPAQLCTEHSFNIEFRSALLVFCPLAFWDSTASWQFLFQYFIPPAVGSFHLCAYGQQLSFQFITTVSCHIHHWRTLVWATTSGIQRFFTSKSQNVGCGLKPFCACSFFSLVVENCFLFSTYQIFRILSYKE